MMSHFQPSHYSGFGASSEDLAIDAGKAVTASTVAGGTVAVGLITAAGGAATVPVAGWVVAAGLAIAAGTVALVVAVKKGKIRRKEALEVAKKLKIPTPTKMPGFIVSVLKMKVPARDKLYARLRKRYERAKKKSPKVFAKAHKKLVDTLFWKIAVIEAIMKVENPKFMTSAEKRAAARADSRRAVPDPVSEQNSPLDLAADEAKDTADEAQIMASSTTTLGLNLPPWGWAAVAVGGVAVIAFVLRGSGGGSSGGGNSSPRPARRAVYRSR